MPLEIVRCEASKMVPTQTVFPKHDLPLQGEERSFSICGSGSSDFNYRCHFRFLFSEFDTFLITICLRKFLVENKSFVQKFDIFEILQELSMQ